jgi:hypothetical protein
MRRAPAGMLWRVGLQPLLLRHARRHVDHVPLPNLPLHHRVDIVLLGRPTTCLHPEYRGRHIVLPRRHRERRPSDVAGRVHPSEFQRVPQRRHHRGFIDPEMQRDVRPRHAKPRHRASHSAKLLTCSPECLHSDGESSVLMSGGMATGFGGMPATRLAGDLGGGAPTQFRVRPDGVVVLPPGGQHGSGRERLRPMFFWPYTVE